MLKLWAYSIDSDWFANLVARRKVPIITTTIFYFVHSISQLRYLISYFRSRSNGKHVYWKCCMWLIQYFIKCNAKKNRSLFSFRCNLSIESASIVSDHVKDTWMRPMFDVHRVNSTNKLKKKEVFASCLATITRFALLISNRTDLINNDFNLKANLLIGNCTSHWRRT